MFPTNKPDYVSILAKLLSEQKEKHKVFISYYHKDNEYYRTRFEQLFGHLFINKSVKADEIDTDVSTEYIKRLIQEDHISDASVLVVLVGSNTYGRKHVDWEISAALNKKLNGYSGLLGLVLPTNPIARSSPKLYDPALIPLRLHDNIKSGYAKLFDWTEDAATIEKYIDEAFKARIDKMELIDNSRQQYTYNRSGNGSLADLLRSKL
jgi:hypothetical protein